MYSLIVAVTVAGFTAFSTTTDLTKEQCERFALIAEAEIEELRPGVDKAVVECVYSDDA